MEPNTQHQLWSHWVFHVRGGRRQTYAAVKMNFLKWANLGFGSVGEARIQKTVLGWKIELRVEGSPAHDPEYVDSVKRSFALFAEMGWGTFSWTSVNVKVLAGDLQNGKPRAQVIVLPSVRVETT